MQSYSIPSRRLSAVNCGKKGLFSSLTGFGKYDPFGTLRVGFPRNLAPRPPPRAGPVGDSRRGGGAGGAGLVPLATPHPPRPVLPVAPRLPPPAGPEGSAGAARASVSGAAAGRDRLPAPATAQRGDTLTREVPAGRGGSEPRVLAPPGHLVEASSGECRGRRPAGCAERGEAPGALPPSAGSASGSALREPQSAPSRGRGRPAPGNKAEGRWDGGPGAGASRRGGGRGEPRAGTGALGAPPAARAARPSSPYLSRSARPCPQRCCSRRGPSAGPRRDAVYAGRQKLLGGGGGSLGPAGRPRARPALALRAAPVAAGAAAPPPRPLGPPPSPPAARPSPPPRPLPSPVPPLTPARADPPPPGPDRRLRDFLWGAPANEQPELSKSERAPTRGEESCLPSRLEGAPVPSAGERIAEKTVPRGPPSAVAGGIPGLVGQAGEMGVTPNGDPRVPENAGVPAAFRRETWVPPGAGMAGAGGRAGQAGVRAVLLRSQAVPLQSLSPEGGRGRGGRCSPRGVVQEEGADTEQPWKNFLGGMAVGLHGKRRQLAVCTPDPREGQREASPLASLPAV